MPFVPRLVRRRRLAAFPVWLLLCVGSVASPAAAQDLGRPTPSDEIKLRLAEVEREQRELRGQMPGVAGPIAIIAVGGGLIVASGFVAFGSWAFSELSWFASQEGESSDPPFERPTRILIDCGMVAAAGGAVVSGGVVWMVRRLQQRRTYAPAARELRHRRRQLLERARMLPAVGANHAGLLLTTNF